MNASPDLTPRARAHNRLPGRVSVMTQITTMVAMTATGVITGFLAHGAQVKDQLAAQARARRVPPVITTTRVVQRPVKTVVVRVRGAQPTRRAVTVVRTTSFAPPTPVYQPAPAPKPAKRPAVTKTSGS